MKHEIIVDWPRYRKPSGIALSDREKAIGLCKLINAALRNTDATAWVQEQTPSVERLWRNWSRIRKDSQNET